MSRDKIKREKTEELFFSEEKLFGNTLQAWGIFFNWIIESFVICVSVNKHLIENANI